MLTYLLIEFIAENVAKQWNITREMQDNFAASSQRKCGAALESGYFENEVVPVDIQSRTGRFLIFDYVQEDKIYSYTYWKPSKLLYILIKESYYMY